MALFTDGMISAPDDLPAHDSGILDVASLEGINLTSKLKLAQEELALELPVLLGSNEGLGNIVVTTALRLWHAFRTLELVYRDAYSNQLNERYGRKRDQFAEMAKWALNKLVDGGVGITSDPVIRADPADLSFFPGQQPAATYYVSTSWVNIRNEEGSPGECRAISVPDGNILSVRPVNLPSNAVGWNVFVGLSLETMIQQNESVLPPAERWLHEGVVLTAGRAPGTGQAPDHARVVSHLLRRG